MNDKQDTNKPPISDSKKYGLLAIAAALLIGAYYIGQKIQINPTYDANAKNNVNAQNVVKESPKGEFIKLENLKLFPSDQIMGDPSEKPAVTLVEYASFTCSHCSDFHNNALSKIKKEYIDGKKIQYIFRDYPLDGAGLKASLLAKCDLSKRVAFGDVLFKKQAEWTKAKTMEDIEKNLMAIGKIGGLSAEQITACFNNKETVNEILEIQKQSDKLYNIEATPTLLINNQKFIGGLPFGELKNILDTELENHAKKQGITE